jgi:hypothetical protein
MKLIILIFFVLCIDMCQLMWISCMSRELDFSYIVIEDSGYPPKSISNIGSIWGSKLKYRTQSHFLSSDNGPILQIFIK